MNKEKPLRGLYAVCVPYIALRRGFLYCFEVYMKELFKDDNLDFSDMINNLRRDFKKLEKTITTVPKKEQQKVKNKKSDEEVMKEFFKLIGLE